MASIMDIGPIPPVRDPERKEACRHSFRLFCETYMPEFFKPEFMDHRRLHLIDTVEAAITRQRLCVAPADGGIGATSFTIAASLWLSLYGKSLYTVTLSCNTDAAAVIGDLAEVELEGNERLLEDFPDAVFPIRQLQSIKQRCYGQTYEGRPTEIELKAQDIRLPRIAGAESSGCVIASRGVWQGLMGMSRRAGPDSVRLRPTFLIVDDPFGEAAANSPSQCEKIKKTVFVEAPALGAPGTILPGVIFLGPTSQLALAMSEVTRRFT